MLKCDVCGKKVTVGYNRPHSQHKTKRKIFPNVQKTHGRNLCMKCLKTANRNSKA